MFKYDVFLSHSSVDKPAVETLTLELQRNGLRVFFDQWELVPGTHWQDALQEALASSRTCAVFLGAEPGPWHTEEMRVALSQRVEKEPKRVIPVLLPGVQVEAIPEFLKQRTWVDFRAGLDNETALERLVAGIRGSAPTPTPPSEAAAVTPAQEVTAQHGRQGINKVLHSPLWRHIRLRHLGIAVGLLGILLTLLAWIFPRGVSQPDEEIPSPVPDIYALRIQVLDPSGRPIDGSSVRVSSGNEPHLLPDGWWQLEIPRAKLPLNGQIRLWAEHPLWKTARKVVNLGEDPNLAVEIRLEVPRERIGGSVVDAEGRLIRGARVSVQDHDGSSAITNSDGRFELWVTAARDEKARLYVEHADYPPPQGGSCFVGRDGCALILETDR